MEGAQLLSSVKAQQIHQHLFSRLTLTRLTGFSMMMLSIMFWMCLGAGLAAVQDVWTGCGHFIVGVIDSWSCKLG